MVFDFLARLTRNPGYRFLVLFGFDPVGAFTECTLPAVEWDIKTIDEGGLNTGVHNLIGRRKKGTLILKNGIGMGIEIMLWYNLAMQEIFWRERVTVTLLNSYYIPVFMWHLSDCVPVKWTGPQLNTENSTIAIQTLEIAVGDISMIIP